MRRSARDLLDPLRAIGGVLFAAGAIVLLIRKSGHGGWSDGARVALVFVPATFLYLMSLQRQAEERARPWQSVLAVAATLLIPVLLYEFLHWIGANTRHLLYDAGVFALTGLLAAYATRRSRVSYTGLIAALSFLATWLFVWGKILNHASANTFRWLLVAAAAVLLLTAARLARSGAVAAGETAIAGGVAAVAAGLMGVIVGAGVGGIRSLSAGGLLTSSTASSSGRAIVGVQSPRLRALRRPTPEEPPKSVLPHIHTTGLQHFGWDLYLLLTSLALLWIGSRMRVRGLGYVGAIGLGAFIVSVGVQITRLQAGDGPTHGVLIWPLVLIVVGAAALLLSMVRARQR